MLLSQVRHPSLFFIHLHRFHTLQAHLHSSAHDADTRGERKSRRGGCFRHHVRIYFPRQSDSSQRKAALVSPPLVPTRPQANSTNNMAAEVVSHRDTSRFSTSWTRHSRFGGRLVPRTQFFFRQEDSLATLLLLHRKVFPSEILTAHRGTSLSS